MAGLAPSKLECNRGISERALCSYWHAVRVASSPGHCQQTRTALVFWPATFACARTATQGLQNPAKNYYDGGDSMVTAGTNQPTWGSGWSCIYKTFTFETQLGVQSIGYKTLIRRGVSDLFLALGAGAGLTFQSDPGLKQARQWWTPQRCYELPLQVSLPVT